MRQSPQKAYEPVRPCLFHIARYDGNVIILKLNPGKTTSESLDIIKTVFTKYDPASPLAFLQNSAQKKLAYEK